MTYATPASNGGGAGFHGFHDGRRFADGGADVPRCLGEAACVGASEGACAEGDRDEQGSSDCMRRNK